MYFDTCTTPDEMRALYRRLVFDFHPDRGGDGRKMQQINDEYHDLLKRMDGQEFKRTQASADRPTWTYHYDQDQEDEIIRAIARILAAVGNRQDVEVTLVGLWVWVVGNTKSIKEELKAVGCWWNKKRFAWNWHPPEARSRYNENVTLDEILSAGIRVTVDQRQRLGA